MLFLVIGPVERRGKMTRKSITTSKVRLILNFFLYVSLLIYIYSPHAKKQTYSGAKAAKFRSTSHHMISAAPSLISIEYQLNLRRQNPTVHLAPQGNIKSQIYFSKKNNYLHTYVAMYSVSTESHVPRDGRIFFMIRTGTITFWKRE